MRTLLILACTCAWLHTGEPFWLLAWGAVLIRTSPARSSQAERKPEADTAPGKIPPPVKKTPDRHRAAHRAWMKDISNQ